MKSKKARVLVITLSVLLALILVSVAAFQVFFRLPQPSYSGTISMEGLKAPVEVRTDDHGIPHIFAQNEDDLFFAQGFITARDRMFQMDIIRLAGRGELSLLFGDKMVEKDKYFKTLGIYRAAESEYNNISPLTKAAVDSYTRGVNAYLDTVKFLPAEYTILGAKPQAWKPADSMAAGLLMSYSLNCPRLVKPILYMIYKQAGPDVLKDLMPYIPEGAPYISSSGNQGPTSARCDLPGLQTAAMDESSFSEIEAPIPLRMHASSWMIFSGSRTTTGKPVFTGSPDLAAAIPSLFYLVHLKGGAYDVIGGSIAGVPGVHTLGFNGHIAWSITVGCADNLDYFTEKLNPANPDQYLTEDGYKDFQVIDETVKIKDNNGIRDENFKVKISRHGPIISDVMREMPPECAMLWPGLLGHDGTAEGLLALNRATNFDEFRKALSLVNGASVHLGYADVDGNIGYEYVTTFPIRKAGDNPLPRPGEKGEYDWIGYKPFEEQPYELNPARGYLASFNQMPKAGDYYGTAYFLFERPFRFEQIVNSKAKFTVDEIRSMQNDVVSHVAERWVPLILKVCEGNTELVKYTAIFKGWNYAMDIDSPQATFFNSFFNHLISNTFEDELGKKIVDELCKNLMVDIPAQWLIRYMDDNTNKFWDVTTTPGVKETRDDMVLKSMKDAVNELEERLGSDPQNRAWGKVHQMTIKHQLGGVLPFLNLSPLPYAGDDFTINAGWWDREHPYDMYSGAAIRIVVDMSDLSNMTIMSPPGQSGQYLSPYYSDLAETWSKGGQVPAHYTDAKQLKQVLTLEPGQAK
ncbi:MAG: penicillin acylase family protein [Dehalococcoidia bacterium]